MKLEAQVTSFEYSKKLKESGILQKAWFSWQVNADNLPRIKLSCMVDSDCLDYAAFTASELLEMLPTSVNDWNFMLTSERGVYEVKYCNYRGEKQLWVSNHTNIVNALATMLIALAKRGLL